MSGTADTVAPAETAEPRRAYDGTLRRRQASETRDRIVAAGDDLLGESAIRDWGGLTIRAVADRAGVSERTVYRHFTNERGLRDAVMHRMEERAGIDLEALALEDIATVAARIFASVASHPPAPPPSLDPTLGDASRRQHDALLRALGPCTPDWKADDRAVVAAMFDVLWGVAPYERLVGEWALDPDRAVAGITWVIGLIEQAVRAGDRPSRELL